MDGQGHSGEDGEATEKLLARLVADQGWIDADVLLTEAQRALLAPLERAGRLQRWPGRPHMIRAVGDDR